MGSTKFAGFQWDQGNWPKCGKHGVSQEQIEAVLLQRRFAPSPAHSATEQRFVAVGAASSGKPMFVVFVIRDVASKIYLRPISARYMHAKEAQRYEAQSSGDDHG